MHLRHQTITNATITGLMAACQLLKKILIPVSFSSYIKCGHRHVHSSRSLSLSLSLASSCSSSFVLSLSSCIPDSLRCTNCLFAFWLLHSHFAFAFIEREEEECLLFYIAHCIISTSSSHTHSLTSELINQMSGLFFRLSRVLLLSCSSCCVVSCVRHEGNNGEGKWPAGDLFDCLPLAVLSAACKASRSHLPALTREREVTMCSPIFR